MTTKKLDLRTISLATDMFARDTGLTGPQIHRVFAQYTNELGSYPSGGGSPSRWQLFETGLQALDAAEQRQVLLELCDFDAYRGYSPPPAASIAKLRGQLLEGVSPGADLAHSKLSALDWQQVQRRGTRRSRNSTRTQKDRSV